MFGLGPKFIVFEKLAMLHVKVKKTKTITFKQNITWLVLSACDTFNSRNSSDVISDMDAFSNQNKCKIINLN